MCIPGNEGGPSYDSADATNDANFKFGLGLLDTGLSFFGNRQKVSRQNRLLEQQHADDVYEYNLKNQIDSVKWGHELLDAQRQNESEYVKAVNNIATSQLEIWNSAVSTGNAVAASYAKMLSVGQGEQTGRRAGGTAMLKAIQTQGREMAELGAKLSGDVATAALKRATEIDGLRRTTFANSTDAAMGRPIPGTPPVLRKSEYHQQENPLSLVSSVGSAWLDRKSTLREMTPPPTYEVGSSKNYETAANTFDFEVDSSRFDGSIGDFGTNSFDIG